MAEEQVNQEEQNLAGQPDPNNVAAQQAAEAQAKNLGWVPKDEFRGDPEQWRDASEFVQHGENTLPILRENLKRLHSKLDAQGNVIKDFAEHHKKVEERSYQRALKKLKEERLEAVDKGDTQEFKKKDKEIEDLKQDKPAAAADDKKPAPAFSSWEDDNQWYGTDEDMSMYADQVGSYLNNKNPDWNPAKVYAEVTKRVKIKFPAKFTNARRDLPAAVEGGGTGLEDAGGAGGGKTFTDLPPEAKKAFTDFVEEKLMTKDDKEQYVKDYFEE